MGAFLPFFKKSYAEDKARAYEAEPENNRKYFRSRYRALRYGFHRKLCRLRSERKSSEVRRGYLRFCPHSNAVRYADSRRTAERV